MTFGTQRRRGPDCASDLTLDRLLGDELDAPARAAVESHLGACQACGAARDGLARDRQAFVAEAPVPSLAADALARAAAAPAGVLSRLFPRLARLWVPLTLAAGLGAAALLLIPSPRLPTMRAKGGFALATFVQHPEGNGRGALHLGEPLHPGDRLQFRYSGPAGYLAVLAIDAAAQVSLFYPPGGVLAAVTAGRDVALASAVELDATLGAETIVALRCDTALPTAQVLDAARRAVADARAAGRPVTDPGALDLPCAEVRQRITKSAAGAPAP